MVLPVLISLSSLLGTPAGSSSSSESPPFVLDDVVPHAAALSHCPRDCFQSIYRATVSAYDLTRGVYKQIRKKHGQNP
jgi:hypothetical protein